MKERRQPLCDFTPEQVRAQKEAKKRAPALASADVKVPVSGSEKPSPPAPQSKATAVPAMPESQGGAEVKPDLADCDVIARGNAPKQSRSQKCERKSQAALDRHSAEAPRDDTPRKRSGHKHHRRRARYR
jgi:hypothetical protein